MEWGSKRLSSLLCESGCRWLQSVVEADPMLEGTSQVNITSFALLRLRSCWMLRYCVGMEKHGEASLLQGQWHAALRQHSSWCPRWPCSPHTSTSTGLEGSLPCRSSLQPHVSSFQSWCSCCPWFVSHESFHLCCYLWLLANPGGKWPALIA